MLEVRNLHARIGDKEILRGINLTIKEGERHAIMDSVSVKTTFKEKLAEKGVIFCSIVNGYAKEVLNKLPMEFAVEAQKLLSVSLEGTIG